MAKSAVKKKHPVPVATKEPAGAGTILSMEEAILMLKTTRPSFNRWLRAGKFTGMKVGRQWRFYKEEVERFMRGENPRQDTHHDAAPLNRLLEEKISQLGAKVEEITGRPDYFKTSVRAADLIILLGLKLGASDIHVEPGQATFKLRYRVDGIFQPAMECDSRWLSYLMHQLKNATGCNNNERVKPQDGRIKFDYQGKTVELRVSFMLAKAGETAILNFVETNWASTLTLKNALPAVTPGTVGRIERLIAAPFGLFLTVGPTGSGKTTTLYAFMNHLNVPEKKLISIDASTQVTPGITQLEAGANGNTYAQLMRLALKSDPNVIMSADVPDAETMEMVIKAALTGHVVLSSLHASDSASALKRMVDIGIDPAYVGDATIGILSQRLLRKVCPHCSVKEAPLPADLESAKKMCKAGGLDLDSLPDEYCKAVGCAKCNHTGFKGRAIIIEVLEVTPEIRSGLKHGASVEQLRAIAIQQGMISQAAEAIRAAAEGKTSFQEAMRVAH